MTLSSWCPVRRITDLFIVAAVAFTAALLASLEIDYVLFRLVFGLPLALFLPGYALCAALFPQPGPGKVERILLSLGISVAIASLGGLLLHWTPWGLSPGSWGLLLSGITGAACLLAVRRRTETRLYQDELEESPFVFDARQLALFGLAALVAVLAFGIARVPTSPDGLQGYTMLWLLPSAEDPALEVRLGILSQEFADTSYRLELKIDGKGAGEWPDIRLSPGQAWEAQVEIPAGTPGSATIEALLYQAGQPEAPYRKTRLERSASP